MAKSKCGTCQYRQQMGIHLLCNYICVTGHMRGCSTKDCTRYVKGKRLKSADEENFGDYTKINRSFY